MITLDFGQLILLELELSLENIDSAGKTNCMLQMVLPGPMITMNNLWIGHCNEASCLDFMKLRWQQYIFTNVGPVFRQNIFSVSMTLVLCLTFSVLKKRAMWVREERLRESNRLGERILRSW